MKTPPGNSDAARILKISVDPMKGTAAAAEMLEDALSSAHVIHITGGGTDDGFLSFWADAAEMIATVDLRGENPLTLERLPAVWNDIRYDPALATTYRHSNTAQPLHTDGAYNANPPDIGFFFCQRQAKSGGRTTFIDGDYLCAVLKREAPQLYADLTSVPVSFSKGDSPGQAVPIIGRDDAGPLINWNYYRFAPGQGKKANDLRETFFKYLDDRFVKAADYAPLHLGAGDCMVFHDLRVIHGREAYEAERAGDRCLWNMNLHWGRLHRKVA